MKFNTCKRVDICPTLILWQKLYDAITDVVDNITLADLIEWQQNKVKNL